VVYLGGIMMMSISLHMPMGMRDAYIGKRHWKNGGMRDLNKEL